MFFEGFRLEHVAVSARSAANEFVVAVAVEIDGNGQVHVKRRIPPLPGDRIVDKLFHSFTEAA